MIDRIISIGGPNLNKPDGGTKTAWRLLPISTANAARHMATDEAIFEAYARGLVPPTLRFYTWDPPGVSCGRFQNIDSEVDLEACKDLGIDVVRRPTGGRAVLHLGDLTYLAVVGERDGLPEGVLPAYLYLSRGLLAGLASLDLPAELFTPSAKSGGRSSACFASPSWYELTVRGRKVAGSAQWREDGNVLQHGAIMLDFPALEQAGIFRSPLPKEVFAGMLAKNAAGLREYSPALTVGELAEALALGFGEALGVELAPGGLTEAEEALITASTSFMPQRTRSSQRVGGHIHTGTKAL